MYTGIYSGQAELVWSILDKSTSFPTYMYSIYLGKIEVTLAGWNFGRNAEILIEIVVL